jgi:transcription termination factor NusB
MSDIDFGQYLSEEERKSIAEDAFRQHCAANFKADAERIFSNTAYHAVEKLVNEAHDGKTAEIIAEKTLEVINRLSEYTVFGRKDSWEKQDSEGYKALNDAIIRHKDAIDERLKKIIDELDPVELTEMLRERAAELLDEKLFGKAA